MVDWLFGKKDKEKKSQQESQPQPQKAASNKNEMSNDAQTLMLLGFLPKDLESEEQKKFDFTKVYTYDPKSLKTVFSPQV